MTLSTVENCLSSGRHLTESIFSGCWVSCVIPHVTGMGSSTRTCVLKYSRCCTWTCTYTCHFAECGTCIELALDCQSTWIGKYFPCTFYGFVKYLSLSQDFDFLLATYLLCNDILVCILIMIISF